MVRKISTYKFWSQVYFLEFKQKQKLWEKQTQQIKYAYTEVFKKNANFVKKKMNRSSKNLREKHT